MHLLLVTADLLRVGVMVGIALLFAALATAFPVLVADATANKNDGKECHADDDGVIQ